MARVYVAHAGRANRGVEPDDIVQIAHSVTVDARTRVAAVKYLEAHQPELAVKYRVAESNLDPSLQLVDTETVVMRKNVKA